MKKGPSRGPFCLCHAPDSALDRVDDTHIVVANDNNYPFDVRKRGQAGRREFILLDVADFLNAE